MSGKRGLSNLGNTCYMNSILQCLSHLQVFNPINQELLKECHKYKGRESFNLMNKWNELLTELWSDNSDSDVVNPREFLKCFLLEIKTKVKSFDGFHQNDIDEFLSILMEFLHNSLKKRVNITVNGKPKNKTDEIALDSIRVWKHTFKDDYSYIIKKFYSQYLMVTSCSECDYITTNHDPVMVLTLPIPQNDSTLVQCLDDYTEIDKLDCDNSWKCDKCHKLTSPDRKIMLWNCSDVLTILLKRYDNRLLKNNARISFNEILDISKYNINYEENLNLYSLSGISIQSGGLEGGHYYAVCKNINDNKWYIYDDSNVSECSLDRVLNENPYCLFYERIKK
jgi:ubiquitin carboxyl-terminal hydrolase 8